MNVYPLQTELRLQVRELATDTRNEAYMALDETVVEYYHRKMIKAYQDFGNLCDHQMSEIIGLQNNLVSARRNDLSKPHYIEEYGYMVVKARDENEKLLRHYYQVFSTPLKKMVNSSGQQYRLMKI